MPDVLVYIAACAALYAPIIIGAIAADLKGLFTIPEDRRTLFRQDGYKGFFGFWDHDGIKCSLLVNLVTAWSFVSVWNAWSVWILAGVLLALFVGCEIMLLRWARGDNDPRVKVLSAFSYDGRLTLAGHLLALHMAMTATAALMYFITSGPIGPWPYIFAAVLIVQLACGLLLPPLRVWGSIHDDAKKQFGGSSVGVVVLLALRVLNFK